MIGSMWLSEIAQATGGRFNGTDAAIDFVTTDSRKAESGALFVALKGERFDAHDFVSEVAGKGATAVVVERLLPVEIAQIVVADTLVALGQVAKLNRDRFKGPLVAVTGSSGKTSVKEMLAGMLRTGLDNAAAVLSTQGNLNNDIGVPLTLLNLNADHQFAVVELGASALGEIAYTANLASPQVAILNNAMPAHVEGFGSLANIVRAKAEIYEGLAGDGCGIVNLDDANASFWIDRLKEINRKALTFGLTQKADVRGGSLTAGSDGCFSFDLHYGEETLPVSLSVMGRHMVSNALAASAAWIALGLPLSGVKAGLEAYRGYKGRLQTHQINDSLLLIDDSYNANPASMRAAVEALMSVKGPHLLAIGDMAELGETQVEEHLKLGEVIACAGVDYLITCGELTGFTSQKAAEMGVETRHYANVEELIESLATESIPQGALLVKGSRSAGMDRLVDALIKMDS